MGLMDKVMFWKKDDDFDFNSVSADPMNTGTSASSSDPFATPAGQTAGPYGANSSGSPIEAPGYNPSSHVPDAFAQARVNSSTSAPSARDLELISSKLDTIKALLASLDQRVGIIEQIARTEQAKNQQAQQPKNHLW